MEAHMPLFYLPMVLYAGMMSVWLDSIKPVTRVPR